MPIQQHLEIGLSGNCIERASHSWGVRLILMRISRRSVRYAFNLVQPRGDVYVEPGIRFGFCDQRLVVVTESLLRLADEPGEPFPVLESHEVQLRAKSIEYRLLELPESRHQIPPLTIALLGPGR